MVEHDTSLPALARWLSTWDWPMTKERLLALAEEFGWVVTSNRPGKGARWDTGMSAPGASASVLDDVVADLQIRTSDRIDDDAGPGALRDVFADQVESVSGVLGPADRRKPGRTPSATWELANGSELEVGTSSTSCYWVLTSPKFAEIRRDLGGDR